jgi:hypothetical protein
MAMAASTVLPLGRASTDRRVGGQPALVGGPPLLPG